MTIKKAVDVILWRGKAYLPTLVKIKSGGWIDREPVYTARLEVKDLVLAIKKVLSAGQLCVPPPTKAEMQRQGDPLLNATGARSWKALAKEGAAYSISWTDKGIEISISQLDKKGRWVWDPAKHHILPLDTPLEEIAALILEDFQARSTGRA